MSCCAHHRRKAWFDMRLTTQVRVALGLSLFALLMLMVVHTKLMKVERALVLLQDGIVEKNMVEAARIGQTVRPEVREVQ